MFEYLMPLLVMPTYENTLLDRTYRAVVRRQIEYGRQRGVPWGISESGYNTIDQHKTYQYRAFGVPGLGLKRGLAEDLVIAPYASALALMVAPEAACRNLRTSGRRRPARRLRLLRSGRLHAVAAAAGRDQRHRAAVHGASRGHEPAVAGLRAARQADAAPLPGRSDAARRRPAAAGARSQGDRAGLSARQRSRARRASLRRKRPAACASSPIPAAPSPEAHLLSNGRYHVAVTSAGGGYSRWRDLAVTRWREDATRDCYGSFCYLRDLDSGALWSNAWQPTPKPAKTLRSDLHAGAGRVPPHATTRSKRYTQISVSPEDDIELRRITLTNRSESPRTIEVTSYAEVVLAPQAQDESHPAFSNLFVQTELVRSRQAIYCTRRPRSAEERPPWMMHMMTVRGATVGEPSYETDRMRFIGRGRTLASPAAIDGRRAAFQQRRARCSIRSSAFARRRPLQPNESVRIDIVTGVAEIARRRRWR